MKLLKSKNSPSTLINNLEVKWYSLNVDLRLSLTTEYHKSIRPKIKSYKVSEKYMIVQGKNLPNSLCIPILGISIELWDPRCSGRGLGGQILSKSSNI